METRQSEQLFCRAKELMPGGVNSPVRAFQSVGGTPRFIHHAKDQYLYDEDGNTYIDYIGSWGPMILGHNPDFVLDAVRDQLQYGLSYGAATALEVEMAELISEMVPCVEMVRMVNSGTEAVMSAIRAARGFTGRDKIVKFEGCYHGHADAMLVKAGSGVMTAGIPDSSGVPRGCTAATLSAIYNDLDCVQQLFEQYPEEIACVIVEPVAANMGVVIPKEGFLQGLRQICDQYGTLLILDEVITGFRLQANGAIGYFGVKPDLVTYGKIIGGGMPVGAYGGRRDIMQMVSPLGSVYQAGTLSGNPVAMRAGITQLRYLHAHPEVYQQVETLSDRLCSGMNEIIQRYHVPCTVNGIGSLSCLYFTAEPVTDYTSARTADTAAFRQYFHFMLDRGNYFGPSQFEAIFVSNAHTMRDIEKTLSDAEDYFSGK
ncbi:MAG: glutamate-1-semialdehyde 2,1-aminomutase [Ruminococcus sp.]